MGLFTRQKLRVRFLRSIQIRVVYTPYLPSYYRYGGPAPRVAGSVALSLNRMNRILEVNEKLAYVVVEPGVTFFDIYDHFQKHKINLWISVPALGWGSVLGNVRKFHIHHLLN